MPTPSPTELLAFLQEHGFLTLSQVQGLGGGSATRFADSRVLARELVDRNWLTAFQANQLLQGRGGELLLDPYRLLDRLGEGGMGQVFKAYHVSMGRVVALKIIPKDRVSNPVAVGRFNREVRAVAKLSHPNIVIAFDVSQVGETHFLAMEYVDGIDLARLVEQSGPLSIPQACDYIRQAALGLQHAHEKGLVHRDIKPGNLMVARPHSDQPPIIKILDFGLARFETESTDAGRFTQLGNIVGTVDYIAPEQAENARMADIRADIYSLGCSLFYLLTGQPPFPGNDVVERVSARVLGDAPRVRQSRPDVPERLEQVLGKMLARDPAKRFQTPAEVAAVLEAFCKPGKVKAGTPDSVSGKTAAADEGSGKIIAAGKKRTPPAEPSPFARFEEEDKNSLKRSSPRLVVVKPKGKAAAGNKGRLLGLAIGGGVTAVVVLFFFILWMVFPKKDGPKKIDESPPNMPSEPARLVYSVQPTNSVARVAINPAVQVRVEDASGNLVPTYASDVTIAIGTNPGGGVLSGTLTVAAVNGVATFSNLFIDKVGAGYTLTTTDGILPRAVSSAFKIAPAAPHHLVFARQPSGAVSGQAISPAVTVRAEDASGNLVPTYTSDVTIAIGTNPGGGVLSGRLTVAAVNGVATFSNLSIDKSATAYTLTATDGKLPAAVSSAFKIAEPPDDWPKRVAGMPAGKQVEAVIAKLKERNPGFDGKLTLPPKVNGGVVTELQFVTDTVMDISPVRALTGLARLDCRGTPGKGQLADLSPLKDMKLQVLNCTNTQVSDLSPLEGMPLWDLQCGGTKVSDLSPLKGMALRWLFCSGTQVSDLSPLEGMKLTELACDGTRVSDLSPLKGMPLTRLYCSGTKVTDLTPLKGMPLQNLHCDFDEKRDAEILRSIKTLDWINGKPAQDFWKEVDAKSNPPHDANRRAAEWVLSISGTIWIKENGKARQIGAVAGLPRGAFELTAVELSGNPKVSDAGLAHFKECKNLTSLSLQKTQVSDAGLAHFKECKNLKDLVLGGTRVGDAGLAHFKECENLTQLHLGYTKVSDAGLAHFKECKKLGLLDLRGTKTSAAGVRELQKALPKCNIQSDIPTPPPQEKKSGLQYSDLRVGIGKQAKVGDTVEVHYTGWLKDGKKFDSSKDRGKPFSFKLGAGQVIKGWDEGVAGMKAGGKRKLIIPSDLAYGDEGRPPVIPAKAELTFEIELLTVK